MPEPFRAFQVFPPVIQLNRVGGHGLGVVNIYIKRFFKCLNPHQKMLLKFNRVGPGGNTVCKLYHSVLVCARTKSCSGLLYVTPFLLSSNTYGLWCPPTLNLFRTVLVLQCKLVLEQFWTFLYLQCF